MLQRLLCIHLTISLSIGHCHTTSQEELHRLLLDQEMKVLNENPCPCLKYTGKKFISCMDYADKKEVRKTFSSMSLYARIKYLLALDLLAYKRFLDAFSTEKQWQKSLIALPANERELLPQTILEQLIIIRDTWISCAERRVGIYGRGAKDPKAEDIAAWRNKTLHESELMPDRGTLLMQWLAERFMEQKINLLFERRSIAERKFS